MHFPSHIREYSLAWYFGGVFIPSMWMLIRQWQRDGLAVRGDRSDYSVSQLQLLGTRTSIAAEETAAVLRSVEHQAPFHVTAVILLDSDAVRMLNSSR